MLRFSENSYRNQLLTLLFTISALVFCWTGLLQVVESRGKDARLEFHDAYYLVVITLSTVGYGDMHPDTAVGQQLVVLMLIVAALLVPQQLALLRSFRINDAELIRYDYTRAGDTHVVLAGPLDLWSIQRFLDEFYHVGQYVAPHRTSSSVPLL